jgi:hypothetical protein
VLHAGARAGLEQVAGGRAEEVHHGLVLERRRIGHIHHHLRARQRRVQPFARDGVDATRRRGWGDGMTRLRQQGGELFSDEAGASDDHDVHGLP